jgi:2-polyprenyl-3-methyl-5-hydroxy-6-metoxy-1,4-benzoquinol methylase
VNDAAQAAGLLIHAEPVTVDALVAHMRESAVQRRAEMGHDIGDRPPIGGAAGGSAAGRSTNGRADPHDVGDVFLAQADFNHLLAETMTAIGRNLQGMEARFTAHAEESGRTRDQLLQELTRLATVIEAVDARASALSAHLEDLDEKLSRDLERLRELLLARVDGVETKVHDGAEHSEQAVFELRTQMSELDQRRTGELTEIEARIQAETEGNRRSTGQLTEELAHVSALTTLAERMQSSTADAAALEARFQARFDDVRDGLRGDLTALEERVRNGIDQSSTSQQQQFADLEERLTDQLDVMRIRVLRAERSSNAPGPDRPLTTGDGAQVDGTASPADEHGAEHAATATDDARPLNTSANQLGGLPFDYFMFEHRFRGSVSAIKRRHAKYLPLFRDCRNVLDAGCGRGEFIEQLSERGINVTGIDISEDMVDFCRDRGLRVVHADMFDYLRRLPDARLDGFFSAQVVEHLPPERIFELVTLCGKKLESGAVIVIETPNPACPEALGNFSIDPTHVRPVPAQMLGYLLEQASFKVRCVQFSAPAWGTATTEVLDVTGDFPRDVSSYQDYAVVATRSQGRWF